MNTQVLILEDYKKSGVLSEADLAKIRAAAAVIREGGLCALPTETVYGLGGNALMKEASQKIYAAKGRPSDNPLIVHIADMEELPALVESIPEKAARLAAAYWPGPMTMIFRKSPLVPMETTAGLDTVAVRFPSHPAARCLIREAGVPVAAPSANLSGRPSTTTAQHCIDDLTGRVDMILDGGSCEVGLESTIIDVTGEEPQLLRPGAITKEMLEKTLAEAVVEDAALKGPLAEGVQPKAPGMKYRHYAPKAPMVLVCAKSGHGVKEIAAGMLALIRGHQAEAEAGIDVLCSEECCRALQALAEEQAPELSGHLRYKLTGSRTDTVQLAHVLFEYLREFDEADARFIVAEGCSEEELGAAVMNRMKKAAAWQLEYV